jgi:hypothetical protein
LITGIFEEVTVLENFHTNKKQQFDGGFCVVSKPLMQHEKYHVSSVVKNQKPQTEIPRATLNAFREVTNKKSFENMIVLKYNMKCPEG